LKLFIFLEEEKNNPHLIGNYVLDWKENTEKNHDYQFKNIKKIKSEDYEIDGNFFISQKKNIYRYDNNQFTEDHDSTKKFLVIAFDTFKNEFFEIIDENNPLNKPDVLYIKVYKKEKNSYKKMF